MSGCHEPTFTLVSSATFGLGSCGHFCRYHKDMALAARKDSLLAKTRYQNLPRGRFCAPHEAQGYNEADSTLNT